MAVIKKLTNAAYLAVSVPAGGVAGASSVMAYKLANMGVGAKVMSLFGVSAVTLTSPAVITGAVVGTATVGSMVMVYGALKKRVGRAEVIMEEFENDTTVNDNGKEDKK